MTGRHLQLPMDLHRYKAAANLRFYGSRVFKILFKSTVHCAILESSISGSRTSMELSTPPRLVVSVVPAAARIVLKTDAMSRRDRSHHEHVLRLECKHSLQCVFGKQFLGVPFHFLRLDRSVYTANLITWISNQWSCEGFQHSHNSIK